MKFTSFVAFLPVTLTGHFQAAASTPDGWMEVGAIQEKGKYLRSLGANESSVPEIVGGFEQTTVLPWFVAILSCNSAGANCFSCGATLVHSDIVMTAAHCVDKNKLVPAFACVGALTTDFSTCYGTRLSPVAGSLLIHPQWDTNAITKGYDIALFKVSPASTNSVISLNTDASVPSSGQSLYIFGHGRTVPSNPGSGSAKLKGLNTLAQTCTSSDSSAIAQHICIFASSTTGACQGDSGGPLVTSAVTSDPKTAVQLGLTSYGSELCATGYKDVYIRVSFFKDFINAYICANSASKPASCTASASTCFSGQSTVEVKGKGTTSIKDLQVNDKVFVGTDTNKPVYQSVYAFGHYDPTSPTEYLRIHTNARNEKQPIEISPSHLLYVAGQKHPVRADSIQPGDALHQNTITGPVNIVTVTKVEKINRSGAYMPLTSHGSIVVNGIQASTYVSFLEDAPRLQSFLSEDRWVHWWLSPYRMVCLHISSSLCKNDYNEEGIAYWLVLGRYAARVVENWGAEFQMLAVAVFVGFVAACLALETLAMLLGSLPGFSILLLTVAMTKSYFGMGKIKKN